ncbi:J domain-containing protein [Arthrobacter celericrescens]|uniref:J domain-containing protein n=1 Tax=Arthrobacter celericrescens TaxID=2320851 RepID=UPI000EA057DE|nr:J domain-containing protein [Arthrobacter celericrescens]
MGNSHPDYYEILNVPVTATAREITRAYRGLLRQLHPDTRQENHDGGTSEARDLERLHAIMQAYAVLSDAAKRAAYDRTRRAGAGAGTAAGPAGSNGTPVKVRFHPDPGHSQPGRAQADYQQPGRAQPKAGSPAPKQPFRYGPTRWSPLPGNRPNFPRRPV